MYVLHHADQPALYSGLPKTEDQSRRSDCGRVLRNRWRCSRYVATAAVGFLHYIGIGPNETDEGDEEAARRELEKTP